MTTMDWSRVCYGCFRETDSARCPFCGYTRGEPDRPYIALPAGTPLAGRYLVGRVLGMGGFGVTYLGYDLVLRYKVAIKEYMPNGLAMRSSDRYTTKVSTHDGERQYQKGLERFLEEARTLAELRGTPNIVGVIQAFRENGTAYFVMEYIEGRSLKRVTEECGGRLPYAEALAYVAPIMRALALVHAHKLLHRDISPDNILVSDTGRSCLIDFGAARASEGNMSRSVVLKHGYAPVEQYSTHGNQGPWTDVYALSATLYWALTGVLLPDSLDRLHGDTLAPPSQLARGVPAYADAAILRGLAVEASARTQDMETFMAALCVDIPGDGVPPQPVRQPVWQPVQQPVQQQIQQPVQQPVQQLRQQPAQPAAPRQYVMPTPARKTMPAWKIALFVGLGVFGLFLLILAAVLAINAVAERMYY